MRLRGPIIGVCAAAACAAGAAPALADNQVTLDPHASTTGSVSVDKSGNAYVSWGEAAGPPFFCVMPAGKTQCTDRQELPPLTSAPLANNPSEATAANLQNVIQPFVILGADGYVWVVADRYVVGDQLIWESTDGGVEWTAPHEIPLDTTDPPGFTDDSFPTPDQTNEDDLVPQDWTSEGMYLQGTGTTGLEPFGPNLLAAYQESTSGSGGLGYDFDETNDGLAGEPGISAFQFNGPTAVGTSTLGLSGDSADNTQPADVVEAYSTGSPGTIAYYHADYPAENGRPPSPQSQWAGPVVVGPGSLPRLAGGPKGLFLLSYDGSALNETDVRAWSNTTNSFGAPKTIEDEPNVGVGGGLGESDFSGQLAAVTVDTKSGDGSSEGQLQVHLSSGASTGTKWTTPYDIATVPDYSGVNNARLAIGPNGTGWVTYRDQSGLQIADLYPDAKAFAKLLFDEPGNTPILSVAFTCPAVTGKCTVTGLVQKGGNQLGKEQVKLKPGSHQLKIKLTALVGKHPTKLAGKLTVTIKPAGSAAHVTAGHFTATS